MECPSIVATAGGSAGEINVEEKQLVEDDSVVAHMIDVRERCTLEALVNAGDQVEGERCGAAAWECQQTSARTWLRVRFFRFVEMRLWVLELERLMANARR